MYYRLQGESQNLIFTINYWWLTLYIRWYLPWCCWSWLQLHLWHSSTLHHQSRGRRGQCPGEDGLQQSNTLAWWLLQVSLQCQQSSPPQQLCVGDAGDRLGLVWSHLELNIYSCNVGCLICNTKTKTKSLFFVKNNLTLLAVKHYETVEHFLINSKTNVRILEENNLKLLRKLDFRPTFAKFDLLLMKAASLFLFDFSLLPASRSSNTWKLFSSSCLIWSQIFLRASSCSVDSVWVRIPSRMIGKLPYLTPSCLTCLSCSLIINY